MLETGTLASIPPPPSFLGAVQLVSPPADALNATLQALSPFADEPSEVPAPWTRTWTHPT